MIDHTVFSEMFACYSAQAALPKFPDTFCLQILRSDSNLKNSDAEIQQRALEYLKLSTVASPDVLVSSSS